jgi:hypothetical protein
LGGAYALRAGKDVLAAHDSWNDRASGWTKSYKIDRLFGAIAEGSVGFRSSPCCKAASVQAYTSLERSSNKLQASPSQFAALFHLPAGTYVVGDKFQRMNRGGSHEFFC